MSPRVRKIVYAVAFEAGGIVMGGSVLQLFSGAGIDRSMGMATIGAVVALLWSYVFNSVFEAWEARQAVRGRSAMRRAVHGVLFEGGLTVILVPVTAWWLSVSLVAALLYEAGLIGFYLLYAWGFTWGFDRVFGLPQSAR